MINIAKILKDCPKGTKLYSPLYGEVEFVKVDLDRPYNIIIKNEFGIAAFNSNGKYLAMYPDGECLLFPSKGQSDWTKFKVEKERFDPHTFKTFDKVLVRYTEMERWRADFISYFYTAIDKVMCQATGSGPVGIVIPYNDDTKHLVGTTYDCPEYYKWWEE